MLFNGNAGIGQAFDDFDTMGNRKIRAAQWEDGLPDDPIQFAVKKHPVKTPHQLSLLSVDPLLYISYTN